MSWFKKLLGIKEKIIYPLTNYPSPVIYHSIGFDHRLQLNCGCILAYSQKTKQVLKDVVNCSSEEEHRAEIKEDVTKEKWDTIVEMYQTFSDKQEVFGNFSASGRI